MRVVHLVWAEASEVIILTSARVQEKYVATCACLRTKESNIRVRNGRDASKNDDISQLLADMSNERRKLEEKGTNCVPIISVVCSSKSMRFKVSIVDGW